MTEEPTNKVDNPLDILMSEESQNEANRIFNKLDEMCRNILLAFYVDKLSLEEIAFKYNFTSVGAVKVAVRPEAWCIQRDGAGVKARLLAFESEQPSLF